MELAPIAPLSCLDITKQFKYHLIEAYWLQKYPEYYEFFEDLSKMNDKYLILDNSEGIGNRVDDETILEFADKLNVQEVVLPDVSPIKSNDPEGAYKTLERSTKFKEAVSYTHLTLPTICSV